MSKTNTEHKEQSLPKNPGWMFGVEKPPWEWMWCADVGVLGTSFSSILFLLANNSSSFPFILARRSSQFNL